MSNYKVCKQTISNGHSNAKFGDKRTTNAKAKCVQILYRIVFFSEKAT